MVITQFRPLAPRLERVRRQKRYLDVGKPTAGHVPTVEQREGDLLGNATLTSSTAAAHASSHSRSKLKAR